MSAQGRSVPRAIPGLSRPVRPPSRYRMEAKVRELLEERIDLGLPFPFPVMSPEKAEHSPTPPSFSPKEILSYLDSITDPEQTSDLVSFAFLCGAHARQELL